MTLVYLSLWLTLLFVTAAVYFFLTRETARYRRVVSKRLNAIAQMRTIPAPRPLHAALGSASLPQRLLTQMELVTHLQRFLRQAEMRLIINRFVLVSLGIGLGAGALALLLSSSGILALAMTLGGMSTPLFAVLLVVLVR